MRLLGAGMLMFCAFSFGCVGESDSSHSDVSGRVTLTSAHITRDGDRFMVSGLDNGAPSSVLASKVSIDGNVLDGSATAFTGPELNDIQCYFCACDQYQCYCIEVPCP